MKREAEVRLEGASHVWAGSARDARRRSHCAPAVAAAEAYSATTDMMDALAALVEAMRAGITDPANQVRVLLGLAGFN